jgi:hypothetical protein
LAQLCCLNLEVRRKHPITGLLEVQHRYTMDAANEDVKLVQTGFHFDRLEETDEKVDAGEIVREKLEEYERGDSNVINIPMASAMGFIGQLNEFQAITSALYQEFSKSNMSEEEKGERLSALQDALKDEEIKQAVETINEVLLEAGNAVESLEKVQPTAQKGSVANLACYPPW